MRAFATSLTALKRLLTAFALATSALAASGPAALTDDDRIAFGEEIARLVNEGDAGKIVTLLDTFALADRITAGLKLDAQDERDFRVGLLEKMTEKLGKQYEAFSSARFLRLQKTPDETRVLVRLVQEEGAVNYMAFVCTRRAETTRWSDAFIYLSGETLSQTVRRTAIAAMLGEKKRLWDHLTGSESEFAANLPKFQKIVSLIEEGNHAEALKRCRDLPASLQRDRTVLMIRLRAAQSGEEKEYLKVIEDWEAAFPGDATLDFISIDGDIMRKDYDGALKHIDAFAKQIGGDPYLDYLAGNVEYMAGRHAEARKRARAALAAEPKLAAAYDILLVVGLETKAYDDIAAVLRDLQATYPTIDLASIIEGEEYAGFRESEAYRKIAATVEKSKAKSGE